ncbi:hypothetical protein DC31_00500 [Microbacterium sp. CH12i]|nr:hypothetical protein DC31_00500 [Microbacterium sp. CH12i]
MVRFGIEEEFMLLDHRALAPIPDGSSIRSALKHNLAQSVLEGSPVGGVISPEFLDCQMEFSTSPSESLFSAGTELAGFRNNLGNFARQINLVAGCVGTPYGSARSSSVTPDIRYDTIANLMGGLTGEHFVNGLHVHTEVRDPEDRVRALNAVRPWLPVLLALTANSPFWRRQDSGFASWRSIQLRRLATMWCPPIFHDFEDYQHRIDRLVQMDAAVDRGTISWAARLSENYNTVEVRLFDAQLQVKDTLFAAALTRAIIIDQPSTVPLGAEEIDASLWMAARKGMHSHLVDPITGDVIDAWAIAERLLSTLANSLTAHQDDAFVEERAAFVRESGTGADRQRDARSRHGFAGLRALIGRGTTVEF